MGDDKRVEWRMNMRDGTSERAGQGFITCMWGVMARLALKVSKFVKKAWEVGVNDPRKFVHCLKVGIALTAVSIVYYLKPLYNGFGGNNTMWAVMTVVVVFEYTAGATLSKSVNRICGTSLAGFLGLGVHWVASRAGDPFQPFIAGVSVFLFASAATFSRFIPTIKARFDYGALISTIKRPPYDMKKPICHISLKVGANSAGVIRELASTIRNMKKSSKVGILVAEMNNAARELQDVLKSYPNFVIPPPSYNNAQATETSCAELTTKIETSLMEAIQVITVASLLIEIVTRVECIVNTVEELSDLA